jgi:DNA invertase Pin-like site-specific DNA recombinase
MHNSDLITPQHLTRKAIMYIRQSTPQQVVHHQESLRLQYALSERARQLGWPADAIDIIDDDLGLTAASAKHRAGFNTLVAQVTLEQVGLIVSYDVTRLSRNGSDWYPLLDLCGYKGCLIADSDGIDDPATVNGRLLLGLKGTLSEWERHTMKARLTAGLLHKAARGALALTLPTGLVRTSQGTVHKMPNHEAQARLSLVFETFLPCRSASTVVAVFKTHQLLLPRRDRFGDLLWKAPRVAAVLAILKHPASAGAFTYGRTRTLRREANPGRAAITRLPQEQWRVCIPDVYPASISWETSLQMQGMLRDNHAEYDRNNTRGIPRPGKALLHGLVYCSIQAAPVTSVTTCGNSIAPPCVNILPPIPSIHAWSMRFCRPSPPWNSMSIPKRWPHGSSRPSASPPPMRSISNACAMRRPIVSANSTTSIRRIGMSPPH